MGNINEESLIEKVEKLLSKQNNESGTADLKILLDLSLSEENKAVADYESRALKCERHGDIKAAKLFHELAKDERVHVAQLTEAKKIFELNDPATDEEGNQEAEEILAESKNESEKQIYNVEYNYGDNSPGLAIGHVKVKANSEEEALEKAERYASNRHYTDDSYYIKDSCRIVKSGYSNDLIIESSRKNKDTRKNKNESVTYHFSVEDIGISGNNWVFPEEAYKEAKSKLSKLGYRVSDLTDDLEFTVIGDSTGVAYDGVIYSKEDANESVPDENLDKIYKVLDHYMTKLGFNLVEDRKPYFINKKYIKADNTNYIHYIDFTPQMDNDQLKYEVRDEKGRQKLCNTYNILDAIDMDTSLKLIEFDMDGLE